MINPTDLAYMCGVFDGEGTVTVCSRGVRLTVKVAVYNTDRAVIEPFHRYFGGSIYSAMDKRPKNKPFMSMWQAHAADVVPFAREMLRFCRDTEKREKLNLLIRCADAASGRASHARFAPVSPLVRDARAAMLGEYRAIVDRSRAKNVARVVIT